MTGNPDGLEKIKIKQEALKEKLIQRTKKVVDMEGNVH